VERVASDPRYQRGHHERPPKKLGTRLTTFDCLTCDKCVAVCPNDALFTYVAPHLEVPAVTVRPTAAGLAAERNGTLRIDERHQLASFADHCNDCGNCDAFCPEDGGPHLAKPRLFGSIEALRADPHGEGLFVERAPGGYRACVRAAGREVTVEAAGPRLRFCGDGFARAPRSTSPSRAPSTSSRRASSPRAR
jgi:putative selenate reductase